MQGDRHKKQRRLLNPVFATKQLRNMIPIFYDVSHKVRGIIKAKVEREGEQDIDILPWMTRTALELVGQSGLGRLNLTN